MTTELTYIHLTFDAIADTPINLGHHWAGNRLRGALGDVLLRTTCSHQRPQRNPSPEHAANCPACWLLLHKLDPANARRAYSIAPPIPTRHTVATGERFTFTITLYGSGWQFLPYFVLAVSEMGRSGVGRGTFTLASITANNPLLQQSEVLLAPGDELVKVPECVIGWDDAAQLAQTLHAPTSTNKLLQLQFLTPTRLVKNKKLAKDGAFGPFFRLLLRRIDDLGQQYCQQERRDWDDLQQLYAMADAVQRIDAKLEWIELLARSGRDGQRKPQSGIVGMVTYESPSWERLLPYLLLGQGIQVGKSTAKGNGVFQIVQSNQPLYWTNDAFANRPLDSAKSSLRN